MLGSLRGFVDTAASSIPPEANKESNHIVLEDSEAMVDVSSHSYISPTKEEREEKKVERILDELPIYPLIYSESLQHGIPVYFHE